MAFTFRKYGTFTGPGVDIEYRDNDDFSLDPFDGYFNLDDVSMVLANTTSSPADYVYMHLNGSSTATVTLERNSGPIPTFNVEANNTNFSGDVNASEFTAGGKTLTTRKNFDIPHPNKDGWRLRHTCLEGPENAVYFRGRLTNNNVIEFPSYWKNFVDPKSITVSLTQIGTSQDLIIEKIEWGSKVVIKSGTSSTIDCYYLIHATRIDGENLIVEYEGQSPADYPGDSTQYSVVGWDYDIKGGK
jgi:hypothetical protein